MKEEIETFIKMITEKMDNKQDLITLEDLNELNHKLNGYFFQLKSDIMRNQCIIVLNDAMAVDVLNRNKEIKFLESSDLWRNIIPIVRIYGLFIEIKKTK